MSFLSILAQASTQPAAISPTSLPDWLRFLIIGICAGYIYDSQLFDRSLAAWEAQHLRDPYNCPERPAFERHTFFRRIGKGAALGLCGGLGVNLLSAILGQIGGVS